MKKNAFLKVNNSPALYFALKIMKIVHSSKNYSDLFVIRITPMIRLVTKSQDSRMKLKISTVHVILKKYFKIILQMIEMFWK